MVQQQHLFFHFTQRPYPADAADIAVATPAEKTADSDAGNKRRQRDPKVIPVNGDA